MTNGNDDLSAGSLRSQVATCGKGGTITFAGAVTSVNLAQFQDIQLTQDLDDRWRRLTVTINGNSTRMLFVSGGTITLKNLTSTVATQMEERAGMAAGGAAAERRAWAAQSSSMAGA